MTAQAPWYKDGLRFGCTQCGGCCRGPGGFVWLSQVEAVAIAESLNMSIDEFGKKYLRQVCGKLALVDAHGGDCPFLHPESGCTIYGVRPVQCRTFPWWPENIVDAEEWELLQRDCPGVNQGQQHTQEVIEAGLKRHAAEKDTL